MAEAQDTRCLRGPALSSEQFRALGYQTIDALADFLQGLPDQPVAPKAVPTELIERLRNERLPVIGQAPETILREILATVLPYSVHTGHPRYMGFVCSSAAPLGALGEMISSLVNTNAASALMAPIGTELERQAIRWIANLLAYPESCGGLLTSGGNAANLFGLLTARQALCDWNLRGEGLSSGAARPLRLYATRAVHTWLHKAVECTGLGRDAIHWVADDGADRMDIDALGAAIRADRAAGTLPFLIVGSAGTVSRGAIDPLDEIARLAREEGLWFHVDGAYGAPAALLSAPDDPFRSLAEANSVAIDPHKWLYVPIEAGCLLVRDPSTLTDTFAHKPDYYDLIDCDQGTVNYFQLGLQNTRSLRAIKVLLTLRQMGRTGLFDSIAADINCAYYLYCLAKKTPELEALTTELSITTFRYAPPNANDNLDAINREILRRLHAEGSFFPTNATIAGVYALRVCIVNFRTKCADMEALVARVVEIGRAILASRIASCSLLAAS